MVFLKSDSPAKAVSQNTVAEQLQKNAGDIAVCLFQFVEQDDAVRAAAHLFRKRPARVVADVARRRAEQARNAVRLHILRHIHTDKRILTAVNNLRNLFA